MLINVFGVAIAFEALHDTFSCNDRDHMDEGDTTSTGEGGKVLNKPGKGAFAAPPLKQRRKLSIARFVDNAPYNTEEGEASTRAWRWLIGEELAFGRVFLFAPFVMAIGAIWWFSLSVSPQSWGLYLYWSVAALAAFRFRNSRGPLRLTTAGLALALTGALLAQVQTTRLSTVMLDTSVTTHITGVVEAREPRTSGWRYVVRVTKTDDPEIHRPPHRVTLVARGKSPPIEIGGALVGLARLSPPSGPAFPGLVDFGFLSFFDKIGAVGFFYGSPKPASEPAVQIRAGLGVAISERFGLAIETMRDTIATRIRTALPGETGAFANAIITGQRRAMSDQTLDALRNAGLAHVIAISGLHMALAAGIFFSSLRLALALSAKSAEAIATKKVAAVAALAAAFFYLLVSGMQVSAQRAFLMLAIMLVASLFDRPAISLRNVALAGFVILTISPSEVSGPGMQMSFAATLALIAGYGAWQSRMGKRLVEPSRHGALRMLFLFLSGILLTALIGGLSTAPFAIEHFQRVAGYGLVGNLLAMPIITFIVMPVGLLSMLAMPLNLHTPFLVLMGWGLEWVMLAAEWVNHLGGSFDTGQAPILFLPLFLLGFVPLVLLKTRIRLIGVIPIILAFGVLGFHKGTGQQRILVSEDGALLAVVKNTDAAVNRKRPPSFVYDQWKSALSIIQTQLPTISKTEEAFLNPEDRYARLTDVQLAQAEQAFKVTATAAAEQPGEFQCLKDAWCLASVEGGLLFAQILRPGFVGIACDHAAVVVSLYRPGYQKCRSSGFLVTPKMRRQAGTLVFNVDIQSKPDLDVIKSATEDNAHCKNVELTLQPSITSLERQWNSHRLYDWRSAKFQQPVSLPKVLKFNGNAESSQPACLAP